MEREDVVRDINSSSLPVVEACRVVKLPRSTYYRWRRMTTTPRRARGPAWNALSAWERRRVLSLSEEHPEWSSRQIAFYLTDKGGFSVSESSVYRILKGAGKIPKCLEQASRAGKEYIYKPQHVHEQ